jgi:hypothetical protein
MTEISKIFFRRADKNLIMDVENLFFARAERRAA